MKKLVINEVFFRLNEITKGVDQQLRALPWYRITARRRLTKRRERLKTNYRALEFERAAMDSSNTKEAYARVLGEVYRPGNETHEREIMLWIDSEGSAA